MRPGTRRARPCGSRLPPFWPWAQRSSLAATIRLCQPPIRTSPMLLTPRPRPGRTNRVGQEWWGRILAQRARQMADLTSPYDVLVIGGGNAALCAPISAQGAGASVLVLEAAPKFYRGGNTRHTRNMLCAHDSATEILT